MLRFLAIHQVLPRNRAASGRKIYTQIILAELCGIALKILQNILTAGINYDVESISVGQRQLLTIARGVLRDPAVLILDEATSSVDTCTEHEINRAMMVLLKKQDILCHCAPSFHHCGCRFDPCNGNGEYYRTGQS